MVLVKPFGILIEAQGEEYGSGDRRDRLIAVIG